MKNITPLPQRPPSGCRSTSAFVLALAMVATGVSSHGSPGGTVSAQALNPCALVTADDVEPIAGKTSVGTGVPGALAASGTLSCRYSWGVGTGHGTLDVIVSEPARMFPGMTPDQIRQRLRESVRAGTADAVIPDIGDAAVFQPASPVYATATAVVKGRILEVRLDGIYAGEKKDQIVGLLKLAASRL